MLVDTESHPTKSKVWSVEGKGKRKQRRNAHTAVLFWNQIVLSGERKAIASVIEKALTHSNTWPLCSTKMSSAATVLGLTGAERTWRGSPRNPGKINPGSSYREESSLSPWYYKLLSHIVTAFSLPHIAFPILYVQSSVHTIYPWHQYIHFFFTVCVYTYITTFPWDCENSLLPWPRSQRNPLPRKPWFSGL